MRTPEDFLSAVLPWGVLSLHRSGSGSLARKVSYITLLEMEEHLKSYGASGFYQIFCPCQCYEPINPAKSTMLFWLVEVKEKLPLSKTRGHQQGEGDSVEQDGWRKKGVVETEWGATGSEVVI
ncbi:hypothetical protein Bpfe_026219 [Biomphalaria pfeifferi]|uniref:Uncharacterized protein n=1 Tax=Biomphalaria pfeifferi TaxID=112525 RepID=A0AAD8AXN4_BIOPF|nr:hypothetical protein Bpfe_026219 [Biomphalaria pfeifferi]